MSNGCAPVLASYSAITLFTSSMSAVAGSYSRSVVSPWDENVRILDFMFGLLWDAPFRFPVGKQSAGLVPEGHIAPFPTVVKMTPEDPRGSGSFARVKVSSTGRLTGASFSSDRCVRHFS